MNINRPITITDSMITSSIVTETDYSEFSMGTTYAAGDTIMDTTGVEILTLDVAPTPADWAVGAHIHGATSSKYAYIVSRLTSLTYEIRGRTGSFTLGEIITDGTNAADQGAAHPTVTAATDKVHKVYESLKDSNLAKYPPTHITGTDPDWLFVGYTNRWRCLQQVTMGEQTSKATSINYVVAPGTAVDCLSLLNMDATEVTITETDPVEGVAYNETINLIRTDNVNDFYTYCFEDILRKTDIFLTDLPPYINASISITVTYTGGTAKCGKIILGKKLNAGATRYSPSMSITDYSTKDTDTWGNYTFTLGAYSKKMSCSMILANTLVDSIYQQLSQYRGQPIVFCGHEDYSCMIIFGKYNDFNIVIPYPNHSLCEIEIEGLASY
jgi:hypothetical protein